MAISLGPLLLVFIMGLLVTPPTLAQNNEKYKEFLNQHFDGKPKGRDYRYCETMMKIRGLTSPTCKKINTFVHGNSNDIRAVCGKNGVPYTGDLRQSISQFQITNCEHKGGSTRRRCRYRASTGYRHIVIACENGFPVHLDETFFRT